MLSPEPEIGDGQAQYHFDRAAEVKPIGGKEVSPDPPRWEKSSGK
jgi:hypothetical protein